MDPESSDSDVSVDNFGKVSPLATPFPLPAPLPERALESTDAVRARLDVLGRIEAHNVEKYVLLRARRASRDGALRHRRRIQDTTWRSILVARHRRNGKIQAHRELEDAAFITFGRDLEVERMVVSPHLKLLLSSI